MNEELVLHWLNVVWGRHLGVLLHHRGLLVQHAFKVHLTENAKRRIAEMHIDLVIIPEGMTLQLQVKEYNEWLLDHEYTQSGKFRKPSITLLGKWIKTTWDKISAKSIVHGFKKCCISNSMDRSEDSVLWDEDIDGDDPNATSRDEEIGEKGE
ncbi:hypothetical protein J437_LFUL016684 [Ladona fulva]|uniref:DDE-1 domain-containing protein n=1 Tax=Ladona fulva TaxID=123851 RepID=A0A8K0PAE3_LADFU|nr:hypothetical protein J437_LFUL016684 [Ladona fulva]